MRTDHWKRWPHDLCVVLSLALLHGIHTAQAETDVEVKVLATAYTLHFSLSDEINYAIENIICRNGTVDITANDQNVCENLDPCTLYASAVRIKLRAEDSEATVDVRTIEAYTEYKEPKTDLVEINASTDSINLSWKTTDSTCVKYFDISVVARSPDNTFTTRQLSDTNSYTFGSLNACQQHTVTLSTTNNASVIVSNVTSIINTNYSEPGELTLNITNLRDGSTSISWNEPTYRLCVSKYTFKWRRIDCQLETEDTTETTAETTTEATTLPTTTVLFDLERDYTIDPNEPGHEVEDEEEEMKCEWSDSSEDSTLKQFTLTDLQGCEAYTFEILINSNQTSKATEEFTAAEKLPSTIQNPSVKLDATELIFSWLPPLNHAKCVASYSVNLTGPTQRADFGSVEKLPSDTFVNFTSLDPCGNYKMQVVPVSLNGSAGASYETECSMEEDTPSEIIEPSTILGPYSIEISWLTPEYADLCIAGYRVTGWKDFDSGQSDLSTDTTNTTALFDTGLTSCQAYTMQVIPYTKEGNDGRHLQRQVETKSIIIDGDKITFQTVGTNSHSLELNARNQDNANNCQVIFAFFNCSAQNATYTYAETYVDNIKQSLSFQAKLSPLSPYTKYTCEVILYNVAGASKATRLAERTESYFPDMPENVELSNQTVNSLSFNWDSPKYPNGIIRLYQVHFTRYEADYFVPDGCKSISDDVRSVASGNADYVFPTLLPATKYSLQVAAQNDYGIGRYTEPKICATLPSVSQPITNISIATSGPYPDQNAYSANVTVSWTMPCESNGEIEAFQLEFEGKRENHNSTNFMRSVPPDTTAKGRMSYTETELQPEYQYTVQIAVKNANVEKLSTGVTQPFDAPAGIPARLSDDVVGNMRVNAYETNHPTRSAIVRLPVDVLNSTSGTITYIALLLSEKSCAGTPDLCYAALNSEQTWPDVLSWVEAGGDGHSDCIQQYQTTPQHWEPKTSEHSLEIIYTIGEGKCPDESEHYCNGPLQADTEYNLVVRLFTKSGYNDAALLEFKTDAAIKVTLILVSVCCCLLLAFVIGLVVLWVRKRIAWHRDSGQGIEDPLGNVIAKNFAIFYEEVSKPEKLVREFKEISVVALELSHSAAELGCHKNRYADIYPYDKNRVILDIDSEGSDYINASFIDGHTNKKEYIATQGPKPESTIDFWRMVLQHNVRIIVQVTQFREGNTIKCHEYFPYNTRGQGQGLSVTSRSKESFELYDRTELCVLHDIYGMKQKVIHFYFKKWPDHGCPEDPMHLITFVKKVKAEKRPNYSPIVVHCSAGVGRTGTFIGLDLIMQRLKSDSKINIFETVKKLRFQRMKMVQTLQQYTFLYSCTYELVKHKIPRAALKSEVRPSPPTPTPKKVSFPDMEAKLSGNGYILSEPGGREENSTMQVPLPARYDGYLRKSKNEEPTITNSNSGESAI